MKCKCEVCLGERGGVPGNENVYHGTVICDYCLAEAMARARVMQTTVSEAIKVIASANSLGKVINKWETKFGGKP